MAPLLGELNSKITPEMQFFGNFGLIFFCLGGGICQNNVLETNWPEKYFGKNLAMGHGAMGHGPWDHGPWAMGHGPWAMGHGIGGLQAA